MKTILIVAAMTAIAGSAQAQTAKEKYELSERCGRRAAEFFDRQTKEFRTMNGLIRLVHSTYENHYNSSLSKCFIVDHIITTNDGDHRLDFSLFSITEVNENMEYGNVLGSKWNMLGVRKALPNRTRMAPVDQAIYGGVSG